MKILAAVDGSTYTRRMLAYVAAHDEWLGPQHEYTMLHVVPAVPPRGAGEVDRATLKAYYEEGAEKVFKPLRIFCSKQGLKAQFILKAGHAAQTIAEVATKGRYELIVMGSHGHTTLGNLVMGSVATKVLALCTTPALLIR